MIVVDNPDEFYNQGRFRPNVYFKKMLFYYDGPSYIWYTFRQREVEIKKTAK